MFKALIERVEDFVELRYKVRTATPPAKRSPPRRRVKLTPRQLEIALLVADGLSAKEIAARLDLSLELWKLIATTSTKRFGSEQRGVAGAMADPRRSVGALMTGLGQDKNNPGDPCENHRDKSRRYPLGRTVSQRQDHPITVGGEETPGKC